MNFLENFVGEPKSDVMPRNDTFGNSETNPKKMDTNNLNEQLHYYDIVNSINSNIINSGTFLNVSDRYYEHKYCLKIPNISENIYHKVNFHSNRICLLSLAENHPVIEGNKNILKINFKVNKKIDRLQNKVSGKSKRGAQKLNKTSVICYIECSDSTIYPVYSCIDGKLLEINEKLTSNPNLLKIKPDSDGYIALLLPILSMYEDLKSSMLTKEEYFS